MGNLYQENPLGTSIIITCSIFAAIACFAVVARIWSKRSKKAALRVNDYLILLALLGSLALLGILIASVDYGLGLHLIAEVPLTNLATFLQLELALSSVWIVSVTLIKVSILDAYIQVFRGLWFFRMTYSFMALQIAICISVLFQTFFICRPLAKWWDPTVQGSCGSSADAYLAQHIIILITDVGMAVLPVPVLWKLQMPLSKKIAITCIFCVGVLICIISLLRIITFEQVSGDDITHDWAILFLWTLLEPLLGTTLACLPFLQPVASRIAKSSLARGTRRLLLSLSITSESKASRSSAADMGPSQKKRPSHATVKAQGYDRFDGSDTFDDGIEFHSFDVENRFASTNTTAGKKESMGARSIQVTKTFDVATARDRF